MVNKVATYIKEAVIEMKKVNWPSKKQTIHYTVIVIAMSVGLALFFTLLDNLFNKIIELIIK